MKHQIKVSEGGMIAIYSGTADQVVRKVLASMETGGVPSSGDLHLLHDLDIDEPAEPAPAEAVPLAEDETPELEPVKEASPITVEIIRKGDAANIIVENGSADDETVIRLIGSDIGEIKVPAEGRINRQFKPRGKEITVSHPVWGILAHDDAQG